jgi:hypothetical protein
MEQRSTINSSTLHDFVLVQCWHDMFHDMIECIITGSQKIGLGGYRYRYRALKMKDGYGTGHFHLFPLSRLSDLKELAIKI